MTHLMERLKRMRRYLAEALANPADNTLYIEDLNLSIGFLEKQVRQPTAPKIMNGWRDELIKEPEQ